MSKKVDENNVKRNENIDRKCKIKYTLYIKIT